MVQLAEKVTLRQRREEKRREVSRRIVSTAQTIVNGIEIHGKRSNTGELLPDVLDKGTYDLPRPALLLCSLDNALDDT